MDLFVCNCGVACDLVSLSLSLSFPFLEMGRTEKGDKAWVRVLRSSFMFAATKTNSPKQASLLVKKNVVVVVCVVVLSFAQKDAKLKNLRVYLFICTATLLTWTEFNFQTKNFGASFH